MNNLNRNQQIAVGVGVALVILSGLFPPYEGEFVREGDNGRVHMGYGVLVAPPSRQAVLYAFFPKARKTEDSSVLGRFHCRIATSQLVAQWATIILGTAGIVFLLGAIHRSKDETKHNGPHS